MPLISSPMAFPSRSPLIPCPSLKSASPSPPSSSSSPSCTPISSSTSPNTPSKKSNSPSNPPSSPSKSSNSLNAPFPPLSLFLKNFSSASVSFANALVLCFSFFSCASSARLFSWIVLAREVSSALSEAPTLVRDAVKASRASAVRCALGMRVVGCGDVVVAEGGGGHCLDMWRGGKTAWRVFT